jgi:hypothetical protein
MKNIAIGFAVIVVAFSVYVVWNSFPSTKHDLLEIANFLILAFTLIVLVVYAYDTNSIARVTRDRWKREGVLTTTYEMLLTGNKGEPGRTLFRIHNPSTLLVKARVVCKFRLYGQSIESAPAYSGKEIWGLFPQQISQGWFEIDTLLQQKGKTVAAMISEHTQANATTQFTMDLELHFRDELGEERSLPSRGHYFDFDRWVWIPELTQPEIWDC